MKTSNYIITAFFTFLFGGVFVLFVTEKLHPQAKLIGVTNTLEPFSVVIAEPGCEFTLKVGDPKIISYSFQDTCYPPRFNVHNDTLIIFPYTETDLKQKVEVYCKNINEIKGKEKSNIELHEAKYSNLSVNLDKARFSYYYDQNNLGSTVKFFANDSHINIRSVSFERLEVQLNNTKVSAWGCSIGSLSGTLKNQSDLQANVMKGINVESDSTCNFNIIK